MEQVEKKLNNKSNVKYIISSLAGNAKIAIIKDIFVTVAFNVQLKECF